MPNYESMCPWGTDDEERMLAEGIPLHQFPWLALLAQWRYQSEVRKLRAVQAQRLYALACVLDREVMSKAEQRLMFLLGVEHARKG